MLRWFWIGIVGGSLAAAFAIDHFVWPDRVVVWLYAIPILIASNRWIPRVVLVVLITGLVLALDDVWVSGNITTQGALGVGTLMIVGILALQHSFHRQVLLRKLQRQQVVIDTVQRLRQPVTVILGYVQFLEICPPTPTALAKALAAIQRAALDLCHQLNEIIAMWGTS